MIDTKKICFINTNIAWGGGEKWHFNQAKFLKASGFDIHFIVHPESELIKKISTNNFNYFSFENSKFTFLNPFAKSHIKDFFLNENFDAVIMNLPQDVKSFAKIAFELKVPKVIYRRGMDHPIKASLINRKIYPKYITHFIANSVKVKKSIYANIPSLKNKIHVLYNGVSLDQIPLPKTKDKKLILGNLGRLVEQKGQRYLLELACILKKKEINFEIIIAGTGPLQRDLEEQISNLKLKQYVKLLGHINAEDFFKQIDFFVFPSLFEGLSNALLEAQLYQKPTFAYNISSNSEIIINNQNGYLYEMGEIQNMASDIINLFHSDNKISEIQRNGIEILKSKFNNKLIGQQLIELLS